MGGVKRIGFLSFGHWQPVPGSQTQTAQDALRQTIELAVAAEEIGLDGAYVRVHHFARQLASPFPLLSAIGARTSRIEIGTAVIDMRYENPLYMAEEAAAADLISGGRLQLGISRGSPEPALRGSEAFGYVPGEGATDADMARDTHAPVPRRDRRSGRGRRRRAHDRLGGDAADPAAVARPARPDLVGIGHPPDRRVDRGAGHEPDELDPARRGHRRALRRAAGRADRSASAQAWAEAGWEREPRVSVSRSVLPIVTDLDRRYFGGRAGLRSEDQVGYLEGVHGALRQSYIGEPDVIAQELSDDVAVREADTLLLTVPNQLGVEYNAQLLETIARHIAPAIGWEPQPPMFTA